MRSTLFIVSMILGGAIAFAISAPAHSAPWNADCVTFWGGKIPQDKRTPENCPSGRSHWDREEASGLGTGSRMPAPIAGGYNPNPTLPTTVITNSGTVLIVPNYSGGVYPAAVLNVSD